mmetsp:Transcript_69280/g.152913  ORF Transcript_69280/g.152913 Transcript_69280/m.152913 type:complete len:280 (+) Transcript_69280:957-1796(+)
MFFILALSLLLHCRFCLCIFFVLFCRGFVSFGSASSASAPALSSSSPSWFLFCGFFLSITDHSVLIFHASFFSTPFTFFHSLAYLSLSNDDIIIGCVGSFFGDLLCQLVCLLLQFRVCVLLGSYSKTAFSVFESATSRVFIFSSFWAVVLNFNFCILRLAFLSLMVYVFLCLLTWFVPKGLLHVLWGNLAILHFFLKHIIFLRLLNLLNHCLRDQNLLRWIFFVFLLFLILLCFLFCLMLLVLGFLLLSLICIFGIFLVSFGRFFFRLFLTCSHVSLWW